MFTTSTGKSSKWLVLFLPVRDCYSMPVNEAHIVTKLNHFKNKSKGRSFHMVWVRRKCQKLTEKDLLGLCSFPPSPACFIPALPHRFIFFSPPGKTQTLSNSVIQEAVLKQVPATALQAVESLLHCQKCPAQFPTG